MDACVHKIEQQLRRYKGRVQKHKGDATLGGSSFEDLASPLSPEGTDGNLDEV